LGEPFLSKIHAIKQHFLEKNWQREYLLNSMRLKGQMGFSVVKKAQIEAGDGLRTVMDAR
jgi:hypothetical protein